jgi:dTDP-4-amino-4,6-dideoxygalactose transaminase
MKIPLVDLKANYQAIKPEIDAAIQHVIDNSHFILGEPVKTFEEAFAEASDTRYCSGVANGTVAVELALRAMNLKPGDEVIVPVNTFIGTSESVTAAGGKVVFVDVEDDSLNIDPALVEKAITKKTRALIPVHMYGRMANMERMRAIALSHKLILIEDAAHAHLAEFRGEKPGTLSDMATYSFFPAKNLGAFGDAGGIVMDDEKLKKKIDMLRNHGRITKYNHEFEGYNYRLDALQAAILTVKLKHLPAWTKARQEIARRYDNALGKLVRTPITDPDYKHVYYMYVIRTPRRDGLKDYLAEHGIETGIHYPIPLHLLLAYRYLGHKDGDFPVAEKAAIEILSLPMYPELTKEQQDFVIKKVKDFFS